MVNTVIKRDGRVVDYDTGRISASIEKCLRSIDRYSGALVADLTARVHNIVSEKYATPSVEQIQDTVELVLQSGGEFDAAKAYILYRAEKARQRDERPIPPEVRAAFEESSKYFPTPIQEFQYFDKYSRFNYDLGRRETWVETVDRTVDHLHWLAGDRLDREDYELIRKYILEMRSLPSMRLLAMAGEAARRNPVSTYNCSFAGVDSIDSFVEAMRISMAGCGVGYSVESKYVEQFPRIKRQRKGTQPDLYVVEDSSEGWEDALRFGLEHWFDGYDVQFDLSQIRPAGTPLRIKGGRASGPEPLRYLLDFTRARVLTRQGYYLKPLDAHDIMCAVGTASISGGTRRTALISLFDFDDIEMRDCKSGDFERENSQRWNANNSAVWLSSNMEQASFIDQFMAMVNSGRGEPGIFNREAANTLKPSRRKKAEFGTNPCGEINLRDKEVCNLTAAVARRDDTEETLAEKVRVATIIGTIQSLATNFTRMRPEWQKNCEEERLLGVDITGQMDSPAAQNAEIKGRIRQLAVAVNKEYAAKLGINQSAAITCVKPSGNSSQLVDCASGLHTRYAPYYIRRVRVSAHSPVYKVLRDAGVPLSPENGQIAETANTWVASFPVKAPEGAITRHDLSAVQQCEFWLQNKLHWTEHNPSATIQFRPTEVIDMMKWVWDHRHQIGGLSFLPISDAKYAQMPYEEISKEQYEQLAASFPKIDWSKLWRYEFEDWSTAAQELACVSGACEIEIVPRG